MELVRVSERRSGRDRRTTGTYLYTGPERRVKKHRRSDIDRRTEWNSFCIYCGKMCGSFAIKIQIVCRTGVCNECASKRFPQRYSDN